MEDVTYTKVNALESIEVGDIIMLDPNTGNVTRAVIDNPHKAIINSRLVIGVCTESDNTSSIPIVIDGKDSTNIDRINLNGGDSTSTTTNIISGGLSKDTGRKYIKVQSSGEQILNVTGFVDLGDQLCISRCPGKVKSKDFLDRTYFDLRNIGKVIKFTNNKEKVKVLLNIE